MDKADMLALWNLPGLERVREAVLGRIPVSELTEHEQGFVDEMDSIWLWVQGIEGNAEFAAKLMNEPGNVGYDDDGNLVETVGDGVSVRIIKPFAETTPSERIRDALRGKYPEGGLFDEEWRELFRRLGGDPDEKDRAEGA